MLFIRSRGACGHRRDGGALVRKGANRIDETTLNSSEKAFVAALVTTKVAEEITELEYLAECGAAVAPSSGTALSAPAEEPAAEQVEEAPVTVVEEPRRGRRGRRAG